LVPEKDQHHDHDHDHGDDRDHDNEQKKENEIDSTEEKEHVIDVKSSENKEVRHDDRDKKHHHDHHSNDGADKHDDDSDSDSDDEGDEHHHHKVSKQTKHHDHHSHSGHGPSCPHHKHDHKHVHNAHKRDHHHTHKHSTVQHTDDHHHDGHDHGRRLSEGQNTCSSQDDPRCAKDKKTLYEMLGIEKSLFIQLTILFGFLTFFIAEKLGNRYFKHSHHHGHGHGHDENCIQDKTKDEKDTTVSNKSANNDQAVAVPDNSSDSIFTLMQPSGYLNLLADSMHNLTDGIAIGAAFASGKGLAVATFISVILHEVPHEIGDFSILVQSGLR
jgi:zinc transporter ZupT